MNVEENRLRTFTDWPANAAVGATRIAKAGFYYSGHALEVQCFLCGIKISDWNYGDQVMARHRQAAPDCPFVQNPCGTCNVPLIPVPANNSGSASASSAEVSQENSTFERASVSPASQRQPHWKKKKMTYPQRLQTFANWPVPSIVSPERLAKAGFYYLQRDDAVQCVYCKGILRHWEPGDDPDKQHTIEFPDCYFYIHQIDDDELYLCNVTVTSGSSSLTELGLQAHPAPTDPNHTTREGRLQTFSRWPEYLRQTPEMLARAGFYYTGVGDHVRCFHCDGGLRNWKVTDDPWTEHARWFPICEFVILVKGLQFIKDCIDNRPPLDPSIFEGVPEEEGTDTAEPVPTTTTVSRFVPQTEEITDATVTRLLDSSPAKDALKVGVHVERVKRALKKRLEETGTPYSDLNQLIEDVLRDQAMEDDSARCEWCTVLNRVMQEQTDNATGQCNDDRGNAADKEKDEDKTGKSSNKENESDKPDKEGHTIEEKIIEKSKETASLEEENRRLKEAHLCKICMDREVTTVFLPCGHLATCFHCSPSLLHCPICRQKIRATVRTFLS